LDALRLFEKKFLIKFQNPTINVVFNCLPLFQEPVYANSILH